MLVSHEIVTRGWDEVREGDGAEATGAEMCKIPGVGPVSPATAKKIAGDAFLTGLFFDGKDLRHIRRWTRNTPVEVLLALELGGPPEFDGVKCSDCGKRFEPRKTIWSLIARAVPRPVTTSSLAAGRAIGPRPNEIARRASSRLGPPTKSGVRRELGRSQG